MRNPCPHPDDRVSEGGSIEEDRRHDGDEQWGKPCQRLNGLSDAGSVAGVEGEE